MPSLVQTQVAYPAPAYWGVTGSAGNLAVVLGGSYPATSVSDNAGNTWHNLGTDLWYSFLNASFTTLYITSGAGAQIIYQEWNGLNVFDTQTSVNAQNLSFSTSITTNYASGAIIASVYGVDEEPSGTPSLVLTPGSGFSVGPAPGYVAQAMYPSGYSYYYVFPEYGITTSAGVHAVSGSVSGGNTNPPTLVYALIAAFGAVLPTVSSPTFSEPTNLGTLTVSWTGSMINSASLQSSPDNATWSTVASGITATSYTVTPAPTSATYYRVIATNTVGSVTGSSALFTSPATTGAPTLANVPGADEVSVNWSPVGQLGYQTLQRSPDGSTWTTIATNLPSTTSSYLDNTVAALSTYYYRVNATNSVGSNTGTTSLSITTNPPVMALTASPSYPGPSTSLSVALNWQALQLGTSPTYTPQRSTDGTTWTNLISSPQAGTTYVDASVTEGTKYYYRIQGVSTGTGGGTYYSPVVGVYAPGVVAPAAPTLAIDPYFQSVVDLWWPPVISTLPVTYAVRRSPHGVGAWAVLAAGIYGNFWQDTTLTAAGAYDYQIVATDIPPGTVPVYGGYTSTGATGTITVPVLAPAAPTLTQLPNALAVNVTWPAVPGVSSYTLQRSSANGQAWSNIATGLTGTTYTDSSVSAFTRYWYRVVAVASGGSANGGVRAIFTDTAGSIPAGWRLILNGTDQSALLVLGSGGQPVKVEKQLTAQGMKATFALHFEPGPSSVAVWQPVALFFNRELQFSGWVRDLVRTSIAPGVEDVTVTALDATQSLAEAYANETFEQLPAGWIVENLIARKLGGVTFSNVAMGPTVPIVVAHNQSVLMTIQRLLGQGIAQAASPAFRIGPDLDLNLQFSTNLPAAPVVLTDENPWLLRYP